MSPRRTSRPITISLPPEMVERMDRAQEAEHRTRSELVREALREYLARSQAYSPTAAELRAIEKGRAELRRGESFILDELRAFLAASSPKGRPQKRRSRSSS